MTRNLPLLPWHNRESSRNALSETWYGSFSAFTRQKIRLYPGSARTLLQNIITFWNNNWHNKWYLFTHTLQMYGKLTSSIVVECVHKSTSSIVGSGWHSLSAYREITILSTFSVVINCYVWLLSPGSLCHYHKVVQGAHTGYMILTRRYYYHIWCANFENLVCKWPFLDNWTYKMKQWLANPSSPNCQWHTLEILTQLLENIPKLWKTQATI